MIPVLKNRLEEIQNKFLEIAKSLNSIEKIEINPSLNSSQFDIFVTKMR